MYILTVVNVVNMIIFRKLWLHYIWHLKYEILFKCFCLVASTEKLFLTFSSSDVQMRTLTISVEKQTCLGLQDYKVLYLLVKKIKYNPVGFFFPLDKTGWTEVILHFLVSFPCSNENCFIYGYKPNQISLSSFKTIQL